MELKKEPRVVVLHDKSFSISELGIEKWLRLKKLFLGNFPQLFESLTKPVDIQENIKGFIVDFKSININEYLEMVQLAFNAVKREESGQWLPILPTSPLLTNKEKMELVGIVLIENYKDFFLNFLSSFLELLKQ